VPYVRWHSKATVGTIIKWDSSSTDDVCNGNWRPINSRHAEDCHLQLNRYMCRSNHADFIAFPTTVPAVLADSLLYCCLLRVGHIYEYIRQHISESVQSCDAPKQLLQGEKQQTFYVWRIFIAFCVPIFCNPYWFFNMFREKLFYLTLSSPIRIS
jgi:hypothetical protein